MMKQNELNNEFFDVVLNACCKEKLQHGYPRLDINNNIIEEDKNIILEYTKNIISKIHELKTNKSANTEFLEKAQIVGLTQYKNTTLKTLIDTYFSPENNNKNDVYDDILKHLNSLSDVSYILPNDKQQAQFVRLINGAIRAMQYPILRGIVDTNGLHTVIYGDALNTFKNAEHLYLKNTEKEHYNYTKISTVDVILSNVDVNTILKECETHGWKNNPEAQKKGYIHIGNAKFILFNLKDATRASLGKLTTSLQTFDSIKSSEIIDLFGNKRELTEGILSFISAGYKFAKDALNVVFTKILTFTSNIISPFKSTIKSFGGDLKTNPHILQFINTIPINGIQSEGTMNVTLKNKIAAIITDQSLFVGYVNGLKEEMERCIRELSPNIRGKFDSNISGLTLDENSNTTDLELFVLRLSANGCTFDKIIKATHELNKFKTLMGRISADVSFGTTEFPMWKVYGGDNNAKTFFEFMGSRDSIESDKFNNNELMSDLEILGVSCKNQKTYYTVDLYMLYNIETIDTEGKTTLRRYYYVVRTGSESSIAATNKFSVREVRALIDDDETLETLMNRKK